MSATAASVTRNLTLDRARGCLIGLAVGDALGTTLEFSERDSYPHLTDMVGGGPFDLDAGQWTDDTAMALCLAESLLAANNLDPEDLSRRFIRWWQKGENSCTGRSDDIGNTTQEALCKADLTGNPLAGSADPDQAGNGCIMRLAPVAIFSSGDVRAAVSQARLQSRTTHSSAECLDSCEYFATMLVEAINGDSADRVLRSRELDLSANIRSMAQGSYKIKVRNQIHSSGYVIHTLEAALWVVNRTETFAEAVLLAANLGDDADTVAAVTGQLAGALYGLNSIPQHWLDRLAWKSKIESLADRLHEACGQRPATDGKASESKP